MPTTRTQTLFGVLLLAVVGVSYLSVIRWWAVPISIGVLAWFSLHGIAFARRLTQSHDSKAHWLFGPVWGTGLCAVGLLGLWVLGGRGAWVLLVAPWPIWGLLLLPIAGAGEGLALPTFTRRDLLAVLVLMLIVPVIVGLPYAHVAESVEEGGKAYRAYFTADFVWAMTAVAEVSKGDMPPKNPFLAGETLHYYWLAHFLSAVEYRVLRPWGLTIEEITLANSLGYGFTFIAFLYGFVRVFGAGVWAAAGACALVFLANSFEALDRIWAWWDGGQIWQQLIDVNIDAGARWFYAGMPVDGLQRMLLYQPHHLAGYALGLSALVFVARARDVTRPELALAAGSFLGLSLLFSSFTAIIIGVTVALMYAVRLLTPPRWTAMPICALAGSLPVGAADLVSSALGYVDPNAGLLVRFGPNPVAFVQWPYLLLLSFGPPLLIGAVGLVAIAATRRWSALPVVALAGVAMAFYFLIDVPDMEHVWVGWRAGHLLFIALAAAVGLLFTMLASAPFAVRLGSWSLVGLLTAAALPTVVVDVFNAQDITNRSRGASFPWTLVLSRSEVAALDWLKTQTPPDVVVQPDVVLRASESWGHITAFGERRMAAGLPIAMIPIKPYEHASDVVSHQVFADNMSVDDRASVARGLGIDYLYVGPPERRAHPGMIPTLDARMDLFAAAFRNDDVVIYRVKPIATR